jgi:hypothetical protein
MNDVIDRLVRVGLLQPAPPDVISAGRWLEDAARHLLAAAQIAEIDRAGSYVLWYDASRKAIAAILLASGFRVTAASGSHAAVAEAAVSLASSEDERTHLRELDRMRRQRNRSEYGLRSFGAKEIAKASETARWIVDFAQRRLSLIK